MTKRMKRSKMNMELDYDEDTDWETLSVIPMRHTSHKKYCSSVWEYFGQLMRLNSCLDNKNFYCLPCFDLHKLKQYSATTATSNFYTHLRAFHNILPERLIKHTKIKSKLSNTEPDMTMESLKSDVPTTSSTTNVQHNEGDEIELTEYINEDPLSEMLVVRPTKKTKDEVRTQYRPIKQKYKVKEEKYEPNKYTQKRYTGNISSPVSVADKIDEAITTEDYDKLFILSLIKEFRMVRNEYRLDAKADLLGVLRKYQHLSKSNPPQNYHYTATVTNQEQRVEGDTTEFETPQSEY